MKNILVLTDFSILSKAVVNMGFTCAKKNNAQLTIYHSLEENTNLHYSLFGDAELQIEQGQEIRNPFPELRALVTESSVHANFVLGTGDFVSNLNEFLSQNKFDLIIMGSNGTGASNKWGSNAQKIIKEVEVPVLVIKKPQENMHFKNIVFASNFKLEDKDVLTKTIELLKLDKDTLIHFMSVDTGTYFSQPTILMQEVMADFVELAKPIKSDSTFFQDYTVNAGIRHFMDEVHADLLVMSNKERSALKKLIFTSPAVESVGNVIQPTLIMNY